MALTKECKQEMEHLLTLSRGRSNIGQALCSHRG